MAKKFALGLSVLVLLLLAGGLPVLAQGVVEIYVDTAWTGSEDGTKEHPYNTVAEARALAQTKPYGGFIYIRKADGTWSAQYDEYVPSVQFGSPGTPLPQLTLYVLLAILAVGLIVLGRLFLVRARRLGG